MLVEATLFKDVNIRSSPRVIRFATVDKDCSPRSIVRQTYSRRGGTGSFSAVLVGADNSNGSSDVDEHNGSGVNSEVCGTEFCPRKSMVSRLLSIFSSGGMMNEDSTA